MDPGSSSLSIIWYSNKCSANTCLMNGTRNMGLLISYWMTVGGNSGFTKIK